MKTAARLAACLVLLGSAAWGHPLDGQIPPAQPALNWSFEPGAVSLLALTALLYAAGLIRLWNRIGLGHGVRRWRALSFGAGWVVTALALLSPLHQWGATLFAAHMVQHEILLLIAAPLVILGRPLPVMLWAAPRRVRISVGRRMRTWRGPWMLCTGAAFAWIAHATVLWVWHIPALFESTLHSEFAHALQHTSFLGAALLFWFALLEGRDRRSGFGSAVIYLFTTAVHTGILGALLTLTRTPWYRSYAETSGMWGLSALEDQQLGGLIMWIPGGVVYVVAGLALFAAWMNEAVQRSAEGGGDVKECCDETETSPITVVINAK